MKATNLQLGADGKLKHFLTIEGLKRELLLEILDCAATFVNPQGQVASVPPLLQNKTVVNLFFESSTRTRSTFELAAKRLGAEVLSVNIAISATTKGETLLDTIRNLQAMHTDMFVVRHASSGAVHFIAQHVMPHVAVLNAGDGCHAHPTQAMLDMYTIRHFKPDLTALKVAIVGDIAHSRVARSQIHALNTLGVSEVRVVAPKTLLPAEIESLGVQVYNNIEAGLRDVDVIIMLRLQNERMSGGLLPSQTEFYHTYGLTAERLQYAHPDVLVMHPGPINRGVEIASEVADSCQSVILNQVTFGIAVRMAVMAMVLGKQQRAIREDGTQ